MNSTSSLGTPNGTLIFEVRTFDDGGWLRVFHDGDLAIELSLERAAPNLGKDVPPSLDAVARDLSVQAAHALMLGLANFEKWKRNAAEKYGEKDDGVKKT